METVLRDALATDTCNPAGVYFGTRSGKVYGSGDGGNSWRLVAEGLPAVVCVKAAWVGDDGIASPRKHRGTETKKVKSKSGKSRSGARKKVSAKTKTASRARAAR
jgi:hypothetical protein